MATVSRRWQTSQALTAGSMGPAWPTLVRIQIYPAQFGGSPPEPVSGAVRWLIKGRQAMKNCHNVQQKAGEFSAGHSWIRSFMRPFRIGSGVDWEAATEEAVAKVVKTDEWRAFLDERGASDKSPSITED